MELDADSVVILTEYVSLSQWLAKNNSGTLYHLEH